jgi:hypothetical protein
MSHVSFDFELTGWRLFQKGGNHGRDHMVVEFTTTYAISVYNHWSCEFESHSGEVYTIQQYVIKFASDLRQVSGFLRATRHSGFLHQ